MEYSAIFWWTTLWLLFWGVVGSIFTRRVYLRKDLDTSNSILVGAMVGAAFGPVGLLPLWMKTPEISRKLILIPAFVSVGLIMTAFALADPDNNCVSNGSFVASQITNGLIIGIIYGLMALGLTLIFSILGIVSFSHGEFYMIGGMIVYYSTVVWFPGLHPVIGVLIACLPTFMLGGNF
jgi:Branched-chain amino acid ABC-type transport system, permease components